MADVGRRVLTGLLGNLSGAFLGLVAMYLITQNAPPSSLGQFAFGIAAYNLILFLSNLGLHGAFVRALSREPKGSSRAKDLTQTYRYWRNGLITLTSLLALGATLLWNRWFGFTDATTLPVMLIALVYTVTLASLQKHNAVLQREQLTGISQFGMSSEVLVRLIALAVILLTGWNQGWSPAQWGIAIGGTYALGMLGSYVVISTYARARTERGGTYRRDLAKELWLVAGPLALAGTLMTLNSSLDRVMIGYFWNSTQVGLYFTAQRVAAVAIMVPTLLGFVLLPRWSQLYNDQGPTALRDEVRSASRRLFLLLLILAGGLYAFADEAILILGTQYQGATPLLQGYAMILLVQGIVILQTQALTAIGKLGQAAKAAAVMAVTNLVLNAFLIPTGILLLPGLGLAALGAVLATATAMLVQVLLQRASLNQALELRGTFLKVLPAILAIGSVAWVFAHPITESILFGMDRFYEMTLGGVLYVLSAAGALLLVRQVLPEDRRMVGQVLHPKQFIEHLRAEFSTDDPDR